MPYLWSQNEERAWQPQPLSPGQVLSIPRSAPVQLVAAPDLDPAAAALLRAAAVDDRLIWVLITGAPDAVRVNAVAPTLGLKAICDRDEITVFSGDTCARRFYFSAEELPAAEVYRGATLVCPRCKNPIHHGCTAVRCPTCGVFSHHGDPPCWEYAPTCGACHSQPTDMSAPFRWTPEGC